MIENGIMDREHLEKLYAQIPTFDCKPGCSECCGVVPVSGIEAESLPPIVEKKGKDCQFISPFGCTVYENRPLMCRLFGAVNHRALTCPYGAGPELKLEDSKAREIVDMLGDLVALTCDPT